MAQLGFFVDPSDATERTFEGTSTPVPAGWYDARIHSAELKSNNKGYHYINVRYDITGPSNAGRCVFSNIGLAHATSEKVAEVGKEQLAQIAAAINKRIADTDDLVGGELRIKVIVTPPTDKYEAGNSVSAFSKSLSAIPAGPVSSSKPSSGSTPPWVTK